jgi:hypothetical protein
MRAISNFPKIAMENTEWDCNQLAKPCSLGVAQAK